MCRKAHRDTLSGIAPRVEKPQDEPHSIDSLCITVSFSCYIASTWCPFSSFIICTHMYSYSDVGTAPDRQCVGKSCILSCIMSNLRLIWWIHIDNLMAVGTSEPVLQHVSSHRLRLSAPWWTHRGDLSAGPAGRDSEVRMPMDKKTGHLRGCRGVRCNCSY